MMVLISIV